MSEDEAFVFKVTRGEDGNEQFEIELDDEIIDAVFKEYNRLLDNAVEKGLFQEEKIPEEFTDKLEQGYSLIKKDYQK